MDQRRELVRLASSGAVGVSELCRRFGISRDTGHRLLRRHAALGEAGLADGSRQPRRSPGRTAAVMEARVLEVRAAYPAWAHPIWGVGARSRVGRRIWG